MSISTYSICSISVENSNTHIVHVTCVRTYLPIEIDCCVCMCLTYIVSCILFHSLVLTIISWITFYTHISRITTICIVFHTMATL